MSAQQTRRRFLQKSASLAAAGTVVPYIFTTAGAAAGGKPAAKNDRHTIGCIGNGGMGRGDATAAKDYGDVVALCDVDRARAEAFKHGAKTAFCAGAEIYEDYRKLLDRKDIDVVTISTPDHWHTRIAIAAMRAGKDIYCQKPLTLTIDEGRKILKVLQETGRVFQVGTQQRSDVRGFQTAVALCQLGRLGKIRRVTCAIGGGLSGGPFKKAAPPAGLNWDLWLGQTPKVAYIKERCHGTFRWWYEYSGGKLTDWGAHHVDIASWAIGMDHAGPISVEPLLADHPVKLKHGMPTQDDCFNTATRFKIRCLFPNGVEMIVIDGRDTPLWQCKNPKDTNRTTNGILIEGERGRIFVNRGLLLGAAVDELKTNPVPEDVMTRLRKGKPALSHMGNFMACVKDRGTPLSDVGSHHRAMTTCHLSNIAMRLGRKLQWDPATQQIVGDDEANGWQSRVQRAGFEVDAG
jgi:predicted dehydrogenase